MKHESTYLLSRRERLLGLSSKEKEKPKPIAKKSKKTINTDKELKKLVTLFLARPENKFCNIQLDKNCTGAATTVNHKKRRGVNKLNVETFEPSCYYCNNAIENKDQWARDNGHLQSKF